MNSSDFFTADMCTFIGKFNKVTDVAVKRIELVKADPDLGYKFSQLNHPNVVKLLFAERDDLFAYKILYYKQVKLLHNLCILH